jgi:hypothetical protein
MKRDELVAYLDSYLRIKEIEDSLETIKVIPPESPAG